MRKLLLAVLLYSIALFGQTDGGGVLNSSSGGTSLRGLQQVGTGRNTTIQAAITNAGTTGWVIIPSNYAGSDTFTNPNKITILDLRRGLQAVQTFINVKDFGAKGDGVTDDTTAINAAISAAGNSTGGIGGIVYFPRGDYVAGCSAPVEYGYQGVKIMGDTRVQAIIGPVNQGPNCLGYLSVWFNNTPALSGTINFNAAALLTGGTAAWQSTGTPAGAWWYNLRDCSTCAEVNGIGAFTAEATIKPTSVGPSWGSIIGKSAGAADSLATNNSAFELSYTTAGALTCKLNVAGTTKTVAGAAGDIVAGNTYHVALSYDGSNLRCFKNGTQVTGSPVAASGNIVQDVTEDVHFPGGDPSNKLFGVSGQNNISYREMQGVIDGIRLSNNARYTANFTAPTAKFTSDANTLVTCNFTTNYTAGTKCNYGPSGGIVYMPVHISPCPGGVNMTNIEHINMRGGVIIANGAGVDIKDAWFDGNANTGLTLSACNFEIHLEDVWTGAANHRQGMVVATGIVNATRISNNFGKFGIVTVGGTTWKNVFMGVSADAIVPFTVVGIQGSYNNTILTDYNVDYETVSPVLQALLKLDLVPTAKVTDSYLPIGLGPTTAYPVIVNNTAYANGVVFENNWIAGNEATTYYVKYNEVTGKSVNIPMYDPIRFNSNVYSRGTTSGGTTYYGGTNLTDAPSYCYNEKASNGCFGPIPQSVRKLNDTTTGTYPLSLALLTSSGKAIATTPGTTTGVIGVAYPSSFIPNSNERVNTNAPYWITGTVDIGYSGEMYCSFDTATTAGHWAIPSTTRYGCSDNGSTTRPASGWTGLIEETASQPTVTTTANATVTNSGGSIADGTYHYSMTWATCSGGETLLQGDQTFTIATSGANNGKVQFRPASYSAWPMGVCGFRIYVNSAAGGAIGSATLQAHNSTTCGAAQNVGAGPLASCTEPFLTLTSLTNTGAAIPVANTAGPAAKIMVGGN